MKFKREKVKPVFIYLTFAAIIFGSIGTLMLTQQRELTGLAVSEFYNVEEVASHNSREDCWVSAEGKIYDITLFLQIYPQNLSKNCGGELKVNEELKKSLAQYQIGIVK